MMMVRVLVRKKTSGVIIGCPKDVADKYAASGLVEILPVSSSYKDPALSVNPSCIVGSNNNQNTPFSNSR